MTTSKATTHTFFIPLDPMPAPRPRFVVRGKFASAYMPKEYEVWKDRAVECVRGVNDIPSAPLLGPCTVTLQVLVARPKTTKLTHPAPDVDNYAKAVLDAITQSERWWMDDKQVVCLTVEKAWANADEVPGIAVTITHEAP
ncbi:RusA family crossover junction endodeoxyribonuclease [Phenylobacterium sp.]|uniref:RusA family crossover junction endodeoxyribonuclease n=1 Tax=Phenylobacterium sp. TaxID=1871053 RepID=UPI003923C4C5